RHAKSAVLLIGWYVPRPRVTVVSVEIAPRPSIKECHRTGSDCPCTLTAELPKILGTCIHTLIGRRRFRVYSDRFIGDRGGGRNRAAAWARRVGSPSVPSGPDRGSVSIVAIPGRRAGPATRPIGRGWAQPRPVMLHPLRTKGGFVKGLTDGLK